MKKILLKGGEIASSEGVRQADVLVEDGKIVEVGEDLKIEDCEVIDCEGKVVMPGAIDVHVHFRCPGAEYKEVWPQGSAAAVSGGVTTVLDMPNNTPPILSLEDLEIKFNTLTGTLLSEKDQMEVQKLIFSCEEIESARDFMYQLPKT